MVEGGECRPEFLLVAPRNDHAGPLDQQLPGGGQANTAAASGDEGTLVFEVVGGHGAAPDFGRVTNEANW